MRALAVFRRVLQGFRRDKRTLVLMMLAPMLVLSLLWYIFKSDAYNPKLAAVGLPDHLVTSMREHGVRVRVLDRAAADRLLAKNEIDAIVWYSDGRLIVRLEGSDPVKDASVRMLYLSLLKERTKRFREALDKIRRALPIELKIVTRPPKFERLHGRKGMTNFDSFGPVLLGFLVFFFTFIVSGVSFVRERTTGTLERMLASPIRCWELVAGYTVGFTVVVLAQVALMSLLSVYLLDMMLVGSFLWLLVITMMLAVAALTLGMFLSAYAQSEFQLFQFVPLVIVPQIFFSGLFQIETMSPWLQAFGKALPLTYGAEAMRKVMIRGAGISQIWVELLVLAGCAFAFMALNVVILNRSRAV
ncbi:MAG: ABC transporter permease [bacterium]